MAKPKMYTWQNFDESNIKTVILSTYKLSCYETDSMTVFMLDSSIVSVT